MERRRTFAPWIGSLSINNGGGRGGGGGGGGGRGVNTIICDLDCDYHKGSSDTDAAALISS